MKKFKKISKISKKLKKIKDLDPKRQFNTVVPENPPNYQNPIWLIWVIYLDTVYFKACQTGFMVPSMVEDVVLVPKNPDNVSWDHLKPK